ncbi:MAG: hypothetical protein ACRCYP_03445, partial [Alphaproteobacteria bacterium]
NAAQYKVWSTIRKLGERNFGFLVVHSTSLEERKAKVIERAFERTRSSLEKQAGQLAKTEFACEADAAAAGKKLQERVQAEGFICDCRLSSQEVKSYEGRGRPKAGALATVRNFWQAEVVVEEVEASFVEKKLREAATFVLIHNLEQEHSSQEILEYYKNQDKVERGFFFIKQPQYLGPVYIKKANRVEALGYIFLMVLLLAKYLEYRVHSGMAKSGETLKVGGQKAPRPSAKTILDFLSLLTVLEYGGELILPKNNDEDGLKLLRWMGLEERIYSEGLPSTLST